MLVFTPRKKLQDDCSQESGIVALNRYELLETVLGQEPTGGVVVVATGGAVVVETGGAVVVELEPPEDK